MSRTTSRIRVLRVISRMNVGGPARQVKGLLDGLDPDRFEHRVVVGEVGDGELETDGLEQYGDVIARCPGLGRRVSPLGDLVAFTRLRAMMRDFSPHIVHTHTSKAGVLGRLAAWRAGHARTVHTFHGHLLHGYFPRVVTYGISRLERALAVRTDALVSVGSRVRDDLLTAGIGRPEQYHVMAPGVPQRRVVARTVARARLDVPDDAVAVTFVGRVETIKRPDRLIEVARLVVSRHPEVVFLIVGGGPRFAETRSMAKPLGGAVRFLGWTEDIGSVYGASDIALLTSDNEGMPVSLIEAAMAGVPAVTTDVGSAREVVIDGETGFVVERDAVALAGAVSRLVSDRDLRDRLGAAASMRANDEFSVDRLVHETQSLYDSLVAPRVHS